MEGNGGDLGGWPTWQAIAVPVAAFVVPALLSAALARGTIEAIGLAFGCIALQLALVFAVAFAALGYGPV
jgi:hypothetical protein